MPTPSARLVRSHWIALAGAAATLVAIALLQAGPNAHASTVHAAAAPHISNLVVSPTKPVAGKGFTVSFKTTSGGSYDVFEAAGQSGDSLLKGKTGPGKVTTKRIGKKLRAHTYTIGVILTLGNKTARVSKTVVIKKP